jgi:hypothetical protein
MLPIIPMVLLFVVLCGGSNDPDAAGDGLDGFGTEKNGNN